MHVAGLVDLRHGGIDQRVAGAAFAPGGEQGFRVIALLPLNFVVLGFEGIASRVGKVGQNLRIKVAPDQLAEPDRSALTAGLLLLQAGASKLPDGHCAKAQVHTQIARPFDGGEVTRFAIVVHAAQKFVKQLRAAACT